MAIVITMGNFKGGAGKTTNSVLAAYVLAKKGRKVLVVDMDPQANATRILLKTEQMQKEKVAPIDGYLLDALVAKDFSPFIRTVTDNMSDNLNYIPNSPTFKMFDEILEELVPGKKREVYEKRLQLYKKFIDKVKLGYDYVFIDVPPTNSIFTDAALYASDFALFSLQTQTLSLDGATSMLDYLKSFVKQYNLSGLEVLGVLCVILKPSSIIDNKVVRQATKYFDEDNMFTTQIKYMERLKRYADEGIFEGDHHDKNVMAVYKQLVDEIEQRVLEFGVIV